MDPSGLVQSRPRRILPALTIAYMVGLLAGAFFPLHPFWLIIALVPLLAVVVIFRQFTWSNTVVHAAVAVTGAFIITLGSETYDPRSISRQVTRDRESIVLTGVVSTMPQHIAYDASGRTNWSFTFDLESVSAPAADQPVNGKVRVILPSDHIRDVAYGDRWRLAGSFRRDLRNVVHTRGIAGSLYAETARSVRLETDAGSRWIGWCYAKRQQAYERLGWGVGDESTSAAMTRALLLGYRQDVARPVYDAFSRTGTLHVLALSGMHVVIMTMLMVILLKSMGVSRQYWVLFFIPFLTVYTAGTGAEASMVRAVIMAITYFSAFLLRRKPDTPSAMALAALLILIVDPLQLFSLGFILSFVAVGGLVVIYPRLSRWMSAAIPDGVDPQEKTSRMKIIVSAARNNMTSAFGISLACWLATLPLIATFFNLISPVALLVNLVMGPLTFVILLTACLSLTTGMMWDQAAMVFNHANDVFTNILLGLITHTSSWPGGFFYVAAWPIVFVFLWYVLLVASVAVSSWRRWIAMAVLTGLIMVSIGHRSWSRQVEAVVIPNGDAHVLLMDGPGRRAVLIDAGSVYHHRRLIDDLRSRGIDRLDQVWISRATTDAYGGLTPLIDSVDIGEVVIPVVQKKHQAFLRQQNHWIDQLGPDRVRTWDEQRSTEQRNDVILRVVHPAPGEPYRDARRSSMVMHVSHGHESILYTGRMNSLLEQSLARLPVDWQADRLVIGSCDDPLTFTSQWLSLVNPDVVAINVRGFERKPQGPSAIIQRARNHPNLTVESEPDVVVNWTM